MVIATSYGGYTVENRRERRRRLFGPSTSEIQMQAHRRASRAKRMAMRKAAVKAHNLRVTGGRWS